MSKLFRLLKLPHMGGASASAGAGTGDYSGSMWGDSMWGTQMWGNPMWM